MNNFFLFQRKMSDFEKEFSEIHHRSFECDTLSKFEEERKSGRRLFSNVISKKDFVTSSIIIENYDFQWDSAGITSKFLRDDSSGKSVLESVHLPHHFLLLNGKGGFHFLGDRYYSLLPPECDSKVEIYISSYFTAAEERKKIFSSFISNSIGKDDLHLHFKEEYIDWNIVSGRFGRDLKFIGKNEEYSWNWKIVGDATSRCENFLSALHLPLQWHEIIDRLREKLSFDIFFILRLVFSFSRDRRVISSSFETGDEVNTTTLVVKNKWCHSPITFRFFDEKKKKSNTHSYYFQINSGEKISLTEENVEEKVDIFSRM